MTVLLDTNALVWAMTNPAKLSSPAAAAIRSPANRVLVSAACAWEMSTKVRLGKFPEAVSVEAKFLDIPALTGFAFADLTAEMSLLGGRFMGTHKDPFDRMIAAQALVLGVPIISSDALLDTFGAQRIW